VEELDVVTKPTNTSKCLMYIVCLLHVWATFLANVMEVHYVGWMLQDITKVCEPAHRCKMISFNNTWFKINIDT
jgi:hypothetical protein